MGVARKEAETNLNKITLSSEITCYTGKLLQTLPNRFSSTLEEVGNGFYYILMAESEICF